MPSSVAPFPITHIASNAVQSSFNSGYQAAGCWRQGAEALEIESASGVICVFASSPGEQPGLTSHSDSAFSGTCSSEAVTSEAAWTCPVFFLVLSLPPGEMIKVIHAGVTNTNYTINTYKLYRNAWSQTMKALILVSKQ